MEGIESQPGPPKAKGTKAIPFSADNPGIFEVINPSNLSSALDIIARRPAHAISITEHSISEDNRHNIIHKLKHAGWKCDLSPLDPELKHPTGGAALLTRKPASSFSLRPRTAAFTDIISNGRVKMTGLELGLPFPIINITIYGWTGGRVDPKAAKRTDNLIRIAHEEVLQHPDVCFLISGDFNADPAQLPSLRALCNNDKWLDIGAHGSKFGAEDMLPTCFNYNTEQPTRNDYIIASPMLVPYVRFFSVSMIPGIAVHYVLRIQFFYHRIPPQVTINLVPKSIFEIAWDKFAKDNKDADFDVTELNAENRKQWGEFLQPLQDAITQSLNDKWDDFKTLVDTNDSDHAWLLWSKVVETTSNNYLGIDGSLKQNVGRGQPTYVQKHHSGDFKFFGDENEGYDLCIHSQHERRLHLILQQLQQWNARLTLSSKPSTPLSKCIEYLQLNIDAGRLIRCKLDLNNDLEKELAEIIDRQQPNDPAIAPPLRAIIKGLQLAQEAQRRKARQAMHADRKATFAKDGYHKRAYRFIKSAVAHPLQFLARTRIGPLGQEIGTLTSDPMELDTIVHESYDPIYEGNIDDHNAHADGFIKKRYDSLFISPTFDIKLIDDTELMDLCHQGPFTSGGESGFCPKDLSILPLAAFTWWAYLLNAIEAGCPWPNGVSHARSSFLSKTPLEPSYDPLDYRLLLILDIFYRQWCKYRLRSLIPWIKLWTIDGLFAGIPGRGAEDAWWLTSFTIEVARLCGYALTGGAVDIFKCFDQISRALLGKLLLLGGFPPSIWKAYEKFHEELHVRNLLAGGYGKPFHKKCSIPQGCPFSMLFIAFMLRPLILLTEVPGIIVARILADDVLLTAMGDNHMEHFIKAYSTMLEFLQDMGAKVSIKKSYLFSTEPRFRNFLKDFQWPHINCKINVVNDIRDLGAHLNVSARHIGTTLTQRMSEALPKVRRLGWLTLTILVKLNLIGTAIFSGAFYGCEVTHASESHLHTMATAIAQAIHGHAPRRSNGSLFNLLEVEIDPWAVICIRRLLLLRRMIVKNEWLADAVSDAIERYQQLGFPGTCVDVDMATNLTFAPAPGSALRADWKQRHHAWGPIGFLCYSLSHYGLAISSKLRLHQNYEVTHSLLNIPFQFIKPLVTQMIRRGRQISISNERSIVKDAGEIDHDLMRKTLHSIEPTLMPAVKWILTLSFWDNAYLARIGHHDSGLCKCGMVHSMDHWFWECRFTKHLRDNNHIIKFISMHNPTTAFRHGFAPMLGHNPLASPWNPDILLTIGQFQELANACNMDINFGDDFCKAQDFHSQLDLTNFSSARQVVAHHRGSFGDCWDLNVIHDHDIANSSIFKLWSDGGLSSPENPQWSLGGAGIVLKDMPDLDLPGQAPGLITYAFHEVQQGHLRAYASVPGPLCSSTRTELVGIIMALCIPLQLEIATDSLNVVRTLSKIIKNPNFIPNKPWGLMDNGDLWEVVQLLIQARRTQDATNVSITKVKGHATPLDVQNNVISAEDAWGNDLADQYANKGKQVHQPNLHTYAQFFATKHTLFFKALQALYQYIGACMALDSELRSHVIVEDSDPLLGQHPGKIPSLPSGAYQPLTKGISPRVPAPTLLSSSSKNFEQIWVFISWLLVQPLPSPPVSKDGPMVPQGNQQGTSWLELLILFELLGGLLTRDGPTHTAAPNKSLRDELSFFKLHFTRVVDTCLDVGDRLFFGPSKSQFCRLSAATFSNFVACINCKVLVPEPLQKRLLHSLLSCRIHMSSSKCSDVDNQLLHLQDTKLSGRFPPQWRKFIHTDGYIQEQIHDNQNLQYQESVSYPVPETFLIQCPGCSARKEAKHISLFKDGHWNSLKCGACALTKTSRLWNCVCSRPWNSCNLHAFSGFLCQSRTRAPKRKAGFLAPTPGFQSNDSMVTIDTQSHVHKRRLPNQQPPCVNIVGSASTARPPDSGSAYSGNKKNNSNKRKLNQHLVQAEAIAVVSRMRRCEPIPLATFLSNQN